MVRPMKFAFMA